MYKFLGCYRDEEQKIAFLFSVAPGQDVMTYSRVDIEEVQALSEAYKTQVEKTHFERTGVKVAYDDIAPHEHKVVTKDLAHPKAGYAHLMPAIVKDIETQGLQAFAENNPLHPIYLNAHQFEQTRPIYAMSPLQTTGPYAGHHILYFNDVREVEKDRILYALMRDRALTFLVKRDPNPSDTRNAKRAFKEKSSKAVVEVDYQVTKEGEKTFPFPVHKSKTPLPPGCLAVIKVPGERDFYLKDMDGFNARAILPEEAAELLRTQQSISDHYHALPSFSWCRDKMVKLATSNAQAIMRGLNPQPVQVQEEKFAL